MGIFRRREVGNPQSPPTGPLPAPWPAPPNSPGFWPPPLSHQAMPLQVVPPPGSRPRTFARFRLAFSAVLALGLTGSVAVAAMMIYYTIALPDPLSLRHKERAPVIRILASDGSVLAERGAAHDFMPLDLLPKQVTDAVVATEDRRFYEHWGIDPTGMARAFFANLRAGRFAQGGSTLTQQLAKNLFLTHERTLGRKLEELMLALWLELRLTKADILELYLNRVYFGGGAYGIESAAQRYFAKSARELSLGEAAIIAGLLKAPSKYAPSASPAAARARGRIVLQSMLAAGCIGPADEKRANAERITFAEPKAGREPDGVEYAVDFILERMPPLIGAGHAEVVVETTIDAALQRRADAIVSRRLSEHGEQLAVSQAAVVVLDADGGIRALVGGRSHAESQFNRAVKARRQPGSAFKPFVYLAALEAGQTPDQVVHDLPLSIEGWTPRNTTGRFQGAIPLRKALADSVNTVAARLQFDVGARRVVEVARRLGIKSELREDPSLALGTSEVSLIEITGAYGVLANGGAAIQPHAIRRVRMSSGRVLYARRATRTEQVVDPVQVGAMNDMLSAAMTSGTGRRAVLPRHPAAGKTGTTSDFRDAVFVGYTAHFVAGVWTGNDNGKPMNKVMGGGLPADIWREVMIAAHAGKAPLALPGPLRDAPSDPPVQQREPAGKDDDPEVLPWRQPAPPRAPIAQHGDGATAAARSGVPASPAASARPGSPSTLPPASAPPRPVPVVRRQPEPGGGPAQPSGGPPARPAEASAPHPQSRIDEDFVARVVREASDTPEMARLPSGLDFDAIRRRLEAAPAAAVPPPGMMTLGAPPR